MRELTQHQKIVVAMSRNKDKKWWLPKDFMPPQVQLGSQTCVGYEATARFSELASRNTDMFESVKDGKYIKRRIKWETIDDWFHDQPKSIRQAMHYAGATADVKPKPQQIDQMTILPWGQ